ncbi:hypothetical protein NP493_185g02013 [Ridgeia piscesae]|uniref:D-aminoacyl-tRNA deacylase n=1 Tax=Ridgeia piscesae TaxID=27915 RepID=A0AAD9P2J2_RIDPI|nr:hypothetical protein NP493_185g02013 [Ridgeia piscesae]
MFTVGDEVVSSIGRGLCVLIGITRDDTPKDIEYMVRKVLRLRVFDGDDDKRWCKSVMDKQFDVLCVSQFTLYTVLKGNKPDFHLAMSSEKSEEFYNMFLEEMRKAYRPDAIKDGQFGAYMQVNIQNDGPVTITLDSPPHNQAGDKKGGNQKTQHSQSEQPQSQVTAAELATEFDNSLQTK